jgi:hypothetical protein
MYYYYYIICYIGACSTALACQVYTGLDFDTIHSLFSIPVIEDEEEYDLLEDIECNLESKPQRVELVNHTNVLILDEISCLHSYCFNAIMKSYNNLKGKIILCMMDRGQIGPVIPNGTRDDIVKVFICIIYVYVYANFIYYIIMI